jgi:hypothetical protein
MKVVIVGAGISGCIAALSAADAGHEVTILEMGAKVGGILCDHIYESGRYYRNCQYLNIDTPWCDKLLEQTDLSIEVFPHHYGSWNNLFGEVVVQDDFAQIVVPNLKATPINGETKYSSAATRLASYPEPISAALLQWGIRWGALELLDESCCDVMQLSRVFHRADLSGVIACKREYAASDVLYGVPRSLMQPPAKAQAAALPLGGWSAAFETIRGAMEARGVRLHLKAPAKAILQYGKIQVESRRELFKSDLVVWCANPNPLIHALQLERLDSPASRMTNVLFDIEGTIPARPMYWQIFSQISPIVRLFTYHLEGRARMTLEAFDSQASSSQLTNQALRFAFDLGLDIKLKLIDVVPEKRYVLKTLQDKIRLMKLNSAALASNVVPGGWHVYGRNQRLAHIQECMALKEAA